MAGQPMFRRFEDMVWPAPCERMSEVEWKLRHARPETLTPADLLCAAAVIEAYCQMIADPQTKRHMIIRELRKGPNIGWRR